MAGSRQHYLPATYISLFSAEDAIPRRTRKLSQGDRTSQKCITASASDLGILKNIYTLQDNSHNPSLIDDIWADYEAKLAIGIEQMIDGSISALEWARVLVPFVTCLLVRGPDFDERFPARLHSLGFEEPHFADRPDNTNYARVMEIQRLLAPIMVAEWKIVSFEKGEPLLLNDWGFMPVGPLAGIYVPLDRNHVLHITPKTSRLVATFRDGGWLPLLGSVHLDASHRETFNQAIGHNAKRFIFGDTCDSVRKYLYAQGDSPIPPLEPAHLGFITGSHAVIHEFMWHRFVSALVKGISEKMEPQDFDWYFEGLKEAWLPPIIFPTNLPEYPAGLRRQDNFIAAYLYEMPVEPIPYDPQGPEAKT
ncbi:DUF4238 domain-containing protein [Bradyrhizobium sp. CCGB20]|uniref:DUF4238 domain-containing protein n=1 Tax=Bradyrhizobium sp. CCGB20 TaxID=2949633 RepID=UPI0020B3C824|nr:DUF4238 domain-containing protein [Bradyrhizobium sp. CCGB20]MCP3399581.1 DUF4238 domain-containing protein [Bradyrhizobium sp. CCGB20]